MPQPTGSELYVSRPLTNISVAYMNQNDEFIADKVFPSIPVDHQYGQYYKYNKGEWFRTVAQKRAPRTESAGTGWSVGTDTYAAEVYSLHTDVSDQDRANQDTPIIDLDRDATVFVTRDILLRRELDWVTAYFATGLWGNTDQTGGAADGANAFIQWDRASSVPIEDIETERLKMGRSTGLKPNTLVLGPEVESVLKNHAEILERIKYTERGIITRDLMAALFDVDNLHVPFVVQNTAQEGPVNLNSPTQAFVHGKSALLLHVAARPSKLTPSAGYVFEWTGYIGQNTRGVATSKFRMQELKADRVEVESAYNFKLVSSDLGTFFASAVQ